LVFGLVEGMGEDGERGIQFLFGGGDGGDLGEDSSNI